MYRQGQYYNFVYIFATEIVVKLNVPECINMQTNGKNIQLF